MSELEQLKQECEDLRAKLAAAEHRAETFEWADAAKNKLVFEMEEQLAAAGERERRLREALEPLANCFTDYDGLQDDWDSQRRLTVGDFRRADAALAKLAVRTEGERTDTERLDHLENEVDREMRDVNPKGYVSLFRRNEPITRESIDDDMEVPRD